MLIKTRPDNFFIEVATAGGSSGSDATAVAAAEKTLFARASIAKMSSLRRLLALSVSPLVLVRRVRLFDIISWYLGQNVGALFSSADR